ncbi:hypothetical protein M408DRAFT_23518 [Serendipita vermifera MAFF 305830]|uniref:Altered inheritance of mitochondria protein 13, mitochondrial n=1 Tax=Serendipita vermifera MAFF 305830 TaxID=933852 RepID=A0A0C2XIF7_SERVB|nr:hypothetical protein M408DRAFT_23518 [Serendipita vermifera MAFF 305830]
MSLRLNMCYLSLAPYFRPHFSVWQYTGVAFMGGTQSKDPVVLPVQNESSIKFSPALLNQLSNNLDSANPSPEREEALDKHVRQRIQAEISKLQEEEDVVKSALRAALEKENLDQSKTGDDSDATNAGSRGTASLREDIEAVKKRVEKYSQRRQLGSDSAVEASRQAVVKCYRENPERPLDCWRQVEEFKQQVASIETKFVDSLK